MVLAEMLPAKTPAEPLEPRPWNTSGLDSFESLLDREEQATGDGRLIVSHSPPPLLPSFSSGGKLVVVTRDPRDVVTSNYFFMGEAADGWDGSMNRFLASADETPNAFGGWFEHVAETEALVNQMGPERACLLEYELMHSEMGASLEKLARVLGPQAQARLQNDSESILASLGFEEMKKSDAQESFSEEG